MESANLHPHHKVQEQCYVKHGHQVSTTDEWNPNLLLNNIGGKYNRNNLTETIPKPRDLWPQPDLIITSMNQDGFNQLNTEMLYCKHYPQPSTDHDLGGNLWRQRKLSVANNYNMTDLQHDNSTCLGTAADSRSSYGFNHMFPSTNISTSDLCSTLLFPSSLDLNLKSLDLLTSTYHDGGSSCNQYSLPDDHRREHSSDCQSTSSKVVNTSSKRPGSFSERKESNNTDANKKHRSRSPCPTLKVRKEKLGDRVAALQKLVAPFGKTDTSTVLTEAIGYIQFLHDQVQTLSVPFMKSSPRKLYRTVQMGSKEEDGKEEQKPDLGSKGLCLVPWSYASSFVNSCSSGI